MGIGEGGEGGIVVCLFVREKGKDNAKKMDSDSNVCKSIRLRAVSPSSQSFFVHFSNLHMQLCRCFVRVISGKSRTVAVYKSMYFGMV